MAAAAADFLRRVTKASPGAALEEAASAWQEEQEVKEAESQLALAASAAGANLRPEPAPASGAEMGDERLAPPGPDESRKVWFDLGKQTLHEITPYMEIYGRHPREFVFGRAAEMLPSGDRFGFVGLADMDDVREEQDSDDEEEAGCSNTSNVQVEPTEE